ncbi:phosphatase PAP2 family protein [Amycolatopsis rhabdoformis]|uniref:Phosphatase PAP2 family protein n=1 Tax=Amycolatopsis rhabdoformis TaxID=1448059 RepID=A0ABZ1I0F8_9PSEU|nr:phosphatase PAP2 family protein [Amycolatopsis rhabdoformis]WSE27115.1 phosphatase PAP2 family protein [Amycolatopsis rhabdoformis]
MNVVSDGPGDGGMVDAGVYRAVTDFAQSQHWLAGSAVAFGEYGVFLVVPVMLALLWRARGAEALARAAWVPIAVAVALGFDTVLKSLFAEVRPCRVVSGVHPLLPCDVPTDYSFPSNHTVIAAAFAGAVLLIRRAWGVWATVFALLVGASRVYLGAHYPHDVLAGLAVGLAVGLCGIAAHAHLVRLVDRFVPARVVR